MTRAEREGSYLAARIRSTAKAQGKTQAEIQKSVGVNKPNKITPNTIKNAIRKLDGK